MTGPEDLTGRDVDPFSSDRIRAMLSAADLDWSLVEAVFIDRASDVVYALTVEVDDGERQVVLKHPDFVEDDRFRREASVQEYVGERTSIPVPRVLASVEHHDEVPSPFFVVEYVAGTDPESIPSEPDPRDRVRMARACGGHLGALHDLGPLSAFGWLSVADGELTVVDPTADWPAALREGVQTPLDGLEDGRFADLRADLREYVDRELERLSDAGLMDRTPVPTHNDYRPGNLLVSPDSWETVAVLDWGAALAAPREYELAKCEQFFSGWAPFGSDLRERVRGALYEGYEERYVMGRDEAFERRRELYLLVTRIEAMYWLPYWLEDATEAERERTAAEHWAFVSELIE